MDGYKALSTPICKGQKLDKSISLVDEDEIKNMAYVIYAQVIGSLMYLMTCTGLDICYVVGLVS